MLIIKRLGGGGRALRPTDVSSTVATVFTKIMEYGYLKKVMKQITV